MATTVTITDFTNVQPFILQALMNEMQMTRFNVELESTGTPAKKMLAHLRRQFPLCPLSDECLVEYVQTKLKNLDVLAGLARQFWQNNSTYGSRNKSEYTLGASIVFEREDSGNLKVEGNVTYHETPETSHQWRINSSYAIGVGGNTVIARPNGYGTEVPVTLVLATKQLIQVNSLHVHSTFWEDNSEDYVYGVPNQLVNYTKYFGIPAVWVPEPSASPREANQTWFKTKIAEAAKRSCRAHKADNAERWEGYVQDWKAAAEVYTKVLGGKTDAWLDQAVEKKLTARKVARKLIEKPA